MRFKEHYRHAHWGIDNHSIDAMAFIPRRSVTFYGFGVYCTGTEDVTLKLDWFLGPNGNEYSSEEHIVEFKYEDRVPDKTYWSFDIRSVGAQPIKV